MSPPLQLPGPLIRSHGTSAMRSTTRCPLLSIILNIGAVLTQDLLKVLEKLEIGAGSITFLYATKAGNAVIFSRPEVVCPASSARLIWALGEFFPKLHATYAGALLESESVERR
jgi:hypothetical protein